MFFSYIYHHLEDHHHHHQIKDVHLHHHLEIPHHIDRIDLHVSKHYLLLLLRNLHQDHNAIYLVRLCL